MGYMVIRADEVKRIHLDEISVLMIENTDISITGCLISELSARKIKVIFCDEKRNPSSELVSFYGSHDCSAKTARQIQWSDDIKACVWTEIIAEKIRKQSELLREYNKNSEADMLTEYISQIEYNDVTNREGHAAKVYFNALFGMDFTRSTDNVTNAALNYGYSLILSVINREITANGYLTQLGLFHKNMFNPFNLGCDLMEPFRILIDRCVKKANFTEFRTEQKHSLVNLLNSSIYIDGTVQYVNNALKLYCRSVFDALNDGDTSLIKFYKL